jgi:transcriptional regulator
MYIPKEFRHENKEEQLAFIAAHPFGLLLCNGSIVPETTHLPFTSEQFGDTILLHSHLSIANPQARLLKNGERVKVVFAGPHAYISPELYDKAQNVPTWNYAAVHITGTCRVLTETEAATKLLEKTIENFEPAWQEKFKALDQTYFTSLLKGILAFTIEAETIEAKLKISQNKTHNEQHRITESLLHSADPAAKELGETMQKYYSKRSSES